MFREARALYDRRPLTLAGEAPPVSAGITVPERRPNALRSTLQVVIDFVLLTALVTGVIVLPLGWKIACAIALHVVLARLFILGHDACHGSLFRSEKVNAWIGRLVFLPTLTTFSLWHVGHNIAHHGFANLKGRDQVWVPLSPEEFAALPRWRQRVERLYRSVWGFGLYYLVEMWWNKLVFPSRKHVGARRGVFIADSVLASAAAVAYVAFLVAIALLTDQAWWLIVLLGAVLPFLLWNYLMGLVVFVHHTGPEMVWFDKRSEWLRLRKVDDLTRDIRFPWRTEKLLHGIMLHRAHHFDPHIPNYRLAAATRRLFDKGVAQAKATVAGWRYVRDLSRRCALYDYRAKIWLAFPRRGAAPVPA
jgi:omega-6 fatty acid desaturase (delta-12 desaturase)